MKNAIILHGTCDKDEYFSDEYPSLSNSHWLPWLQKQLLINNIFAQTPEIPDAHTPNYEKWKKEFERFEINQDTSLIGHSCGGGFLVRWLSENNVKVNKVVLVAPWLDPLRRKTTDFFEFTIDENLTNKADVTYLLYSTDDSEGVIKSVNIIKEKTNDIKIVSFEGKRHFCYGDLKTEKFPELLELVMS